MRQVRRGIGATCLMGLLLGLLLIQLGALDHFLDRLLVLLALLVVAPPQGSLVLAHKPQMPTCFACMLAFIALLAPQSACKATLETMVVSILFIHLE